MKGGGIMEKYRRSFRVLALVLVIIFLSGCSVVQTTPMPTTSPTSTGISTSIPTVTPVQRIDGEQISFTTEDGLEIYGYVYRGGGDLGVILAHQRARPQPGPPETSRRRHCPPVRWSIPADRDQAFSNRWYGDPHQRRGYYQGGGC